MNLRDDGKRAALCHALDALDIDVSDLNEPFLDAGGDSLQALRLVARLEAVGWSVGIVEILAADSMESICRTMVAQRPS